MGLCVFLFLERGPSTKSTSSVNVLQNGMKRERTREQQNKTTHTHKIIVAKNVRRERGRERHNNAYTTFKKENGWGSKNWNCHLLRNVNGPLQKKKENRCVPDQKFICSFFRDLNLSGQAIVQVKRIFLKQKTEQPSLVQMIFLLLIFIFGLIVHKPKTLLRKNITLEKRCGSDVEPTEKD